MFAELKQFHHTLQKTTVPQLLHSPLSVKAETFAYLHLQNNLF